MALQIKRDDPDDNNTQEEVTPGKLKMYGDYKDEQSDEPDFDPEKEFDTFQLPEGVEKRQQTHKPYLSEDDFNVKMNPGEKESLSIITKLIIFLVVVGVIVVAIKVVFFKPPTDITPNRTLNEQQLADTYGLKFERDEKMDKYIPQYTNGRKVEAKTADGLTVFYIDGVYSGFHITDKKWSLYGIEKGTAEISLHNTSFIYDESFNVLTDLNDGKSKVDFFTNEATNECIACAVNDKSNRVVAITYFNDCKLATETLHKIDE